jgi:type I restriction enzyme, S subunit
MDHQLESLLVGSTFKRINVSDIKALSIIVPPKREQDAICDFLDARLSTYNAAMVRLEREIELLVEHRIRLVADVVTGKLDVRKAAACLSSETALDTIECESDSSDEPEAADEEAAA